jgi:hypothetical protein
MTLPLRPQRGGFLRPFGCAWFVKEFLLGNAPHNSQVIEPEVGAPQSDIFYHYKQALRRVTAEDRAVRHEEKIAKKAKRPINPDNIETLTRRYHSFVTYFSTLQKLGWVEPSGIVEASAFQANYPQGKPRIYFRLTEKGKSTPDYLWADPRKALYSW